MFGHMIVVWWSCDLHPLQDGRHVIPQPEEMFTDDQLKVMKTQDIKYVEMKYHIETKVFN